MSRHAWSIVGVCVCVGTLAASQGSPPPQATYRAGVELVQLDVSVLDKARRPVSGLTAADFTVLVDGRPQAVVAFKAVDVPPAPPPPSAPWMRDVAPDVATNIHPSGRVVAVLIDDWSFTEADIGPGGVRKARDIALATVDALGPDDRAAILFTANSHTAQGFTTDRRLLSAAIENSGIFSESVTEFTTGAGPVSGIDQNGYCYCGVCSVEALVNVAASLRALPEQRKILMFVSSGSIVPTPEQPSLGAEDQCTRRRRDAAHDALRQAHLANVTIEAVDPKGLLTPMVSGFRPARGGPVSTIDRRQEYLRTMAESTGGRAVVNNNDMERQVPAVLAESSTYYLLGVAPPARTEDGRFHPIQVRVNRPGLSVRTRKGFYDPTERDRERLAALGDSRDITLAIAAPVPKSTFPMEVATAAFADPSQEATLAVVLHARQSADGRAEMADVVASLFRAETGARVGSHEQQVSVTWNATGANGGHYEVMSRLPATPGRYELRVGMQTDDGRTASVYTYAEVPDFSSALSLSGLVLDTGDVAPHEAFADLMPVTPTARRTFGASDVVTLFLRIYQAAKAFSPATVTTHLTDTSNKVVLEDRQQLKGTATSSGSMADHQAELPIANLAPGEYLLTVDVEAAGRTGQRQLRFTVEK